MVQDADYKKQDESGFKMRIPLTYCPYCHALNKFKSKEEFKCGTKGLVKRYHQTRQCRLVAACQKLVKEKDKGYSKALANIGEIERIIK